MNPWIEEKKLLLKKKKKKDNSISKHGSVTDSFRKFEVNDVSTFTFFLFLAGNFIPTSIGGSDTIVEKYAFNDCVKHYTITIKICMKRLYKL